MGRFVVISAKSVRIGVKFTRTGLKHDKTDARCGRSVVEGMRQVSQLLGRTCARNVVKLGRICVRCAGIVLSVVGMGAKLAVDCVTRQ
jgi:hypothetical protein